MQIKQIVSAGGANSFKGEANGFTVNGFGEECLWFLRGKSACLAKNFCLTKTGAFFILRGGKQFFAFARRECGTGIFRGGSAAAVYKGKERASLASGKTLFTISGHYSRNH
uniref:hypothetical protein n=1 Tax=Candidatus Scatocola faecigallinarum TaxID=2840916 RepID=UPI0040255F8C